jgi:hypothetical protein
MNPNLKKWFRYSKIVDDAGNPRIVYHGTVADFRVFDPKKSNSSSWTGVPEGAFAFSTSASAAASYANRHDVQGWDSPDNEAAWQRLWDANDFFGANAFMLEHYGTRKTTYDCGIVMAVFLRVENPLYVDAQGATWKHIPWRGGEVRTNDLIEYARHHGHDGLFIQNVRDQAEGTATAKSADTIFVFAANQIKSATGNSGAFSEGNDICE